MPYLSVNGRLTGRAEHGENMIAALFVEKNGAYFNLPGIDPWDEQRDARNYEGPWPVVAHPPCSRWCRLAGLVEAHPAFSDAWKVFGLARPKREGGWEPNPCGGFTCYVEQGRYGHVAKKATWLYAFGVRLPELRWGHDPDARSKALVSWCGNHVSSNEKRPRVGKKAAAKTPPEFREVLLAMARSAR